MGTLLSKLQKFLQGSASYDFLKTWVWPMIAPTVLTIWGWFLSFPGPILFQLALTTYAIGLFIQQTWKKRNTEQQSPIEAYQPQERVALTAEGAINFFKEIKNVRQKANIKIVSASAYLPSATLIADIFLLAGYTLLMNESNTEHIFLARTVHNKFTVRFREKDMDPLLTLSLMTLVGLGNVNRQPFPEASTIDYVQIEVGGAP